MQVLGACGGRSGGGERRSLPRFGWTGLGCSGRRGSRVPRRFQSFDEPISERGVSEVEELLDFWKVVAAAANVADNVDGVLDDDGVRSLWMPRRAQH